MSMGNGQTLIDKIISDAKVLTDDVIAKANDEANEIMTAAKTKAAKEKAKFDEMAKQEAQKAVAKEISSAEMRAKKLILSQKQECLEEVLKEAENKLLSLSGDKYKDTIITMIKNANVDSECEIILSKKDKDSFGDEISQMDYKVSGEVRDIDGGFIVKNGDIEYNYSFKSIISVQREDILQLAAGILFV